jgi:hypothetical protein
VLTIARKFNRGLSAAWLGPVGALD